jgi:DNA (cytosine-5)-methyltransferase 1
MPQHHDAELAPERLFDPVAISRAAHDANFAGCDERIPNPAQFSVVGLFSGIGGIEAGLCESGGEAALLAESWEPARQVLAARFPDIPLVGDVRKIAALPAVDVVTAGFPCTDLSLAGRMEGINGKASGLVSEVFRLIEKPAAPLLLLENVRNMLVLDGGRAMRYLTDQLEALGYRWAYRLVDSRFTGVPQRRQRVMFLASRTIDPRAVLLADDAGEPGPDWFSDTASGFYWTEGRRGLGWARDAVPTLKGGSALGIPSQPAIWNRNAAVGKKIVLPSVLEAEQLQGFPRAWTEAADDMPGRNTYRWKLVGNAVTVGVSRWVARRLTEPGDPILDGREMRPGDRWPDSAFGGQGKVWAAEVSMWPTLEPYIHLHDLVDLDAAEPLSARATTGFLSRARESALRFEAGFLDDIAEHAAFMKEKTPVP